MIHAFPKIFVRLAKFLQTIVIILFVTALTSPYATSAVVTANGFQLKLRTAVCRQRHELLAGTNWHRTREPSIRRLLRSHLRQTFGNRTSIKFARRGINVIKLYAGNPDLNAGAPGTAGNWKAFLDYCYNGGNKPVYVVMFSYT